MTKVTSDPTADMLSRIRNALSVNKREVSIPYSKMKHEIIRVIASEGYVGEFNIDDSGQFKNIIVSLIKDDLPVQIRRIRKISKPGRRVYVKRTEIPRSMSGYGTVIVSTSQGVMTGNEARRRRLGGELICEVA